LNDERFALLRAIVSKSPLLSPILHRWDEIALPDCWLAGGAIAQTVWNDRFDLPATHGINDIDIVYFDAEDLSERTEDRHAARIRSTFSDLPVWIDVKTEARVHLWYEARFGYSIHPYVSATDAIATFPTTATSVGLQMRDGTLALCAPLGISDLLQPIVRPNKKQITRDIYRDKANRWRGVWPTLPIVGWDEA
jgi:hypothetical protein